MGINKDQVEGRAKQATGKTKEVVGKIVGNKNLQVEGAIQKGTGAVQGKFGDLKEDVKKAVKGS